VGVCTNIYFSSRNKTDISVSVNSLWLYYTTTHFDIDRSSSNGLKMYKTYLTYFSCLIRLPSATPWTCYQNRPRRPGPTITTTNCTHHSRPSTRPNRCNTRLVQTHIQKIPISQDSQQHLLLQFKSVDLITPHIYLVPNHSDHAV
jgi:hypothetical protein